VGHFLLTTLVFSQLEANWGPKALGKMMAPTEVLAGLEGTPRQRHLW
jgi:hypothetical protein